MEFGEEQGKKMEMETEGIKALNLQKYHPLALVLTSLILCLCIYKCLIRSTPRKNLPPSPRGFPVIGNLHQLTRLPHRGLHALSIKHGDIMMLNFGVKPVLVVSSARSASLVMKTHDVAIASRPSFGIIRQFLEERDIVGAPYGEYWRQIRSVSVLHLLSNSRVRSYSDVREQEVSSMVAKMEGLVGKEVDLSQVFIGLMNDVVCRVAFGRKYGQKSEFQRLLRELVVVMGGFFVGDFIPWLGWVSKLTGLYQQVERLKHEFDEFLDGIVSEHEERRDRNHDIGNGSKDFVDVLLEVQRDESIGFPLERHSIKGIILDAFVGGTETGFTVLEWTMAELLRHPNSMKALQDEVRGIIRRDQPSIQEEDLHKMKYLKATIKESMRLHPPLPLLVPRESTQDVELDGYTIPAGTQVFTNVWAIQRDPAIWGPDPNEFRPERFLESLVDFKGQDFELIPFGAGRRGCPGINFAMAGMELALASLVGRFDWGLPEGMEPKSLGIEEASGVAVHRQTPLVVVPFLPTF